MNNKSNIDKTAKKTPTLPAYDPKEVLSWAVFAMLVTLFLILKSYSFHWQAGDESVYLYMAWAVIDHSALPYADFFFAHPLLHLLPGIPLFGLLGFTPVTIRIIPVTATVIGSLFLFLLARREIGRIGAVATIFFYLTAFSLLRASTHWTGINLSVMWMIIGLWALTGRRSSWAGVFMALGVCTGNYVLPGAIMAGLLAVLRSGKDGFRYFIGFAIPWALVQLFSMVLGGQAYLDAVYRYHVLKPLKKNIFWYRSIQVFTCNKVLFLGLIFGPILALMDTCFFETGTSEKTNSPASQKTFSGLFKIRQWLRSSLIENKGKSIALTGVLWTLGYLIFISLLSNVFPFYYLLLFPAMALAGGYAVDRYIHFALELARNIRHRNRSFQKIAWSLGAITLVMILAYSAIMPLQHALLPDYVRKVDKPMKWRDAPLPASINTLLHACCFDDIARAYTDYGTIQEVLYHESRFFEKAETLAEYVKNNSTPDQTLFGDASSAGLIALLSGRRIQSDFVDTNTMRFTSRITSIEETLSRIDKKALTLVIVSGSVYRGKSGKPVARYSKFAGLPPFRIWLHQNFHEVYRIFDPYKGWFFILKRNSE